MRPHVTSEMVDSIPFRLNFPTAHTKILHPRLFCSAPRPRLGRHFSAPRDPSAPAPLPILRFGGGGGSSSRISRDLRVRRGCLRQRRADSGCRLRASGPAGPPARAVPVPPPIAVHLGGGGGGGGGGSGGSGMIEGLVVAGGGEVREELVARRKLPAALRARQHGPEPRRRRRGDVVRCRSPAAPATERGSRAAARESMRAHTHRNTHTHTQVDREIER